MAHLTHAELVAEFLNMLEMTRSDEVDSHHEAGDADWSDITGGTPLAVPMLDGAGQEIGGLRLINHKAVPLIADGLMQFCAELIATLLNAGSERDAVNESDQLRDALTAELIDWSDKPRAIEILSVDEDTITVREV
jgi:hypothetical protein